MLPLRVAGVTLWAVFSLFAANVAIGQDFPNKTIRIITGTTGSSADFSARQIGQGISGPLGQPVVVENRPAVVLYEIVAKAPPDGYTLGVGGSSVWIGPLLRKMAYDIGDFSPISLISSAPNVVVVHPSVPAKSVKELIALAKARPGALNYSSGAIGGSSHLAMELFKSMAHVNIVHVPYPGTPQSITALITGEVQLVINEVSQVMTHVKSGKSRALAVTSTAPSALAPGLPTVSDTGLPGYESVTLSIIIGPAGMPTSVVTRLNQEIVRVLNQPEMKAQIFSYGADVVGSSPAQFADKIKSEVTKWGKVIKDAGIKLD